MSTPYPAPPPPPPPSGPSAAGTPWYKKPGPLFLLAVLVAAAVAIPVLLIVLGGDDEEAAVSTSTTAGVTTTAAVSTSTTAGVTTSAAVTTTAPATTTTAAATTTTSGESPCGDPSLDALYAECANGDMQACDDLYVQSPAGSECEAFADTCGGTTSGGAWCTGSPPTTAGGGTDVLDYTLEALFGEDIELTGGFGEEVVLVQAGGPIDVDDLGEPSCTGYATEAPSAEINYIPGGASLLRFYFVADNPGDDTVLIISDPVGNWICDDDYDYGGGIVDPLIDFADPEEGTYDIWVASYATGEIINGKLTITEDAGSTP